VRDSRQAGKKRSEKKDGKDTSGNTRIERKGNEK
jgi:hypothetical protein